MTRVVLSGSAVLDFVYKMERLPTAAEKYQAETVEVVGGGCAANAAVAIRRLGGEAQLIARFGRDEVAQTVLADLISEGVDCSLCHQAENGRSAVSSVYVDAAGERQIMAFRGSGLATDPGPFDLSCDVVLADTRWPEAAGRVIEMGNVCGVPTVLDAEATVPKEVAKLASHVVFSEQGLADFSGLEDWQMSLPQAARDLPGFVAVTLGADGVAWVDDDVKTQAGFNVDVKDTLGAGDVWHGAFALRLAEGAGEEEAMRFASAAAALKCTELGGRKAAPSRDSVTRFLEGQN